MFAWCTMGLQKAFQLARCLFHQPASQSINPPCRNDCGGRKSNYPIVVFLRHPSFFLVNVISRQLIIMKSCPHPPQIILLCSAPKNSLNAESPLSRSLDMLKFSSTLSPKPDYSRSLKVGNPIASILKSNV